MLRYWIFIVPPFPGGGGGVDYFIKIAGMFVVSVEKEIPMFLAVKVSFRVASKEIKKTSFCFGGIRLERKLQ